MPLGADTAVWYAARAGGIVAFALVTASVVAGLALSGRVALTGWPRFAVEDVHRFLGVLAGAFVGVHVLALLIDSYVPFSLVDVVVPGASSYRPLATAIGVVAAELLLALALTNRYRRRLPHRVWRRAHYLNFGVWLLALVHGLTDGSDSRTPWALALYTLAAAAVAGLAAWRLLRLLALAPWARRLSPAVAAVVVAELVVALALGPGGHG